MYLIQDRDGMIRAFVEMMKAQFVVECGHRPTFSDEIVMWSIAREQQEITEAKVRAQGVSPRFATVLSARSKTDQLRALAEEPVSAEEFHALCFNCGTVGYRHESTAFEFMPEHLEIKPDEADALRPGGDEKLRKRFFKRVPASFKERKRLTVHVFRPVDGDHWHVVYFTLRDMFGDPTTKAHHWRAGAHVHYVSRAFLKIDPDDLLRHFESGDWKFPSEHLRWTDVKFKHDADAADLATELQEAGY